MRFLWVLLAWLGTGSAWAADVRVENAWVRATAPGQEVAAAFMDLTAGAPMSLVGADSSVCRSVELHTMRMDGDVMIMRQVDRIGLPKGTTVSLKPGGLHVMLIGLQAPIREGDLVDLNLRLTDADGREHRVKVEAPGRRPGGSMKHHHH